jgi:hypothetical protein
MRLRSRRATILESAPLECFAGKEQRARTALAGRSNNPWSDTGRSRCAIAARTLCCSPRSAAPSLRCKTASCPVAVFSVTTLTKSLFQCPTAGGSWKTAAAADGSPTAAAAEESTPSNCSGSEDSAAVRSKERQCLPVKLLFSENQNSALLNQGDGVCGQWACLFIASHFAAEYLLDMPEWLGEELDFFKVWLGPSGESAWRHGFQSLAGPIWRMSFSHTDKCFRLYRGPSLRPVRPSMRPVKAL